MYPIKKLQDCATIIAGQSPESKYYNSTGEGIPFFQGKADFGELYPKVRLYCSSPTKIAQYNDILLSVRAPVGPTNLSPGTVCIVNISSTNICIAKSWNTIFRNIILSWFYNNTNLYI